MSDAVKFEGMIRIRGTQAKVEKALAGLKKSGVEIADDFYHHHPWPRPFPWPGIPVPFELGAMMRDPAFLRKRITAYNRTVPPKSRVRFKLLPDWGIHGGRKYAHIHLEDKFIPLDENAFGGIIIEGLKELRELRGGNQIR